MDEDVLTVGYNDVLYQILIIFCETIDDVRIVVLFADLILFWTTGATSLNAGV